MEVFCLIIETFELDMLFEQQILENQIIKKQFSSKEKSIFYIVVPGPLE